MVKAHQFVTLNNEEDKVIVYERGELVYVFNFHTNNSYTDYLIGTHWRSPHFILFETDHNDFGGHQRLNEGHNKWINVDEKGWSNRRHSLKLYIPSRCAIVLAPFEFAVKYP
jgi:1,4-alpha-glucan branching enzyme